MQVRLGALPGTYENGEKVSDVLAWNHYGTPTIPPRPVLRQAAEKLSIAFVKKELKAYLKNVAEYSKRGRHADVKRAEEVFLQKLGKRAVAEAKRIIEAHNVEQRKHNAPSTKDKKGFDKPLFETGELEKKLSYEVVE